MEKEIVNNTEITEEPTKKQNIKKEASTLKERVNIENTTIIALVLSIIALWAVKWSLIIDAVVVTFLVYKFFI